MGSKAEVESNSIPKLSLFSLPNQSPGPPGTLTPPLRPPASVPFIWEETPGKPRTSTNPTDTTTTTTTKSLELPPRLLLTEAKITNVPSPTTVLEGPYNIMCRSSSFSSSSASFSFSRERGKLQGIGHSKRESFRERERGGGGGGGGGYFGYSWRKKNVEGSFVISPCSSSLSSSNVPIYVKNDDIGNGDGDNIKVKITRFRRKGSFFSLSNTSSHLWVSIYKTLNQMIPWRRRRDGMKMKKEEESRDLHSFSV